MDRLPGFRDFYPEPLPHQDVWSCDARTHIFDAWRGTARRYGFREYDGPPLEPLELYTLKSGDELVEQMFNFVDKGSRAVSMRPEMTPTLARMIAAHERNYKKPVKWFSIPQLFRYERPGKGRLREHFQLNCDIFGEKDPAADAELIALLIDSLRALKLTSEDFVIRLSSRTAWQEFFQRETGNVERGVDSEYRFFQVIDKLEREREEESAAKLAAIGLSLDAVKAFIAEGKPTADLAAILGNLQARGLGDFVKIDYNVIRGLAYYTGPVFEAFARNSDLRAIAGGGRYDNLVKLISGGKVDLPALGFGMGDVVLLELLKEKKLLPEFKGAVEVVVLVEDESLRAESLGMVQQLREGGWSVDYALTPMKGDKQFKRALELRATHTVRLEKAADGSVQARVKELATRAEKTVAPTELPRMLRTG